MNTIQDIIKDVGRAEFARRMRVSSAATYKWEHRVPAERAPQIESEFGVPRWKLRPDLWASTPTDQEDAA